MNWSDRIYAVGRGIAAIRHREREEVQPLLRAVIEFNLPHLLQSATGSTFTNVSARQLLNIVYPDISPDEELQVASLLGVLDDKIELNRQTNETLEALARALFKDWFVDFGPTRAKAEGAAPYLAPELWELFPDALDENDKPVGWETNKVRNSADIIKSGLTPSEFPEEVFNHYSIPAYDKHRWPETEFGSSIRSNKTCVPQSSVLLSKLNPEICRVWLPYENRALRGICSTEFLVFVPKGNFNRSFLFFLFKEVSFRKCLEGMATGTSKSHQRVNPKSVLDIEMIIPQSEILTYFNNLSEVLLNRISANQSEAQTLAELRDLLLPNLMSGEIRLREAEKAVEAVA